MSKTQASSPFKGGEPAVHHERAVRALERLGTLCYHVAKPKKECGCQRTVFTHPLLGTKTGGRPHGIQPSILGNARINLVTGIYPLPMYRKDGHRGLCPRTPAVYRFAFQEGSRAAAQEKATRPSSPPSRKSGEALGSLLSVALSSVPVKLYQYTMVVRLFRKCTLKMSLTWGTQYPRS